MLGGAQLSNGAIMQSGVLAYLLEVLSELIRSLNEGFIALLQVLFTCMVQFGLN
jgi:hypothetical protein